MRNSNLDASHLFASTPPRAPPRAWPFTPSAMGKRSHRGKKDKDGLVVTTKQPVKPQSVHDISELFVNGGDLKSLGRASTGPFTADALQARYKHVGKTVDVDKNFDFKTLVTQHGGGGRSACSGGREVGMVVMRHPGKKYPPPSHAAAIGGTTNPRTRVRPLRTATKALPLVATHALVRPKRQRRRVKL